MEEEDPAPTRFRNLGFAATWAAMIGFACIVVGQYAEEFAGLSPADASAWLTASGASRPQFNSVDYSATGAIAGKALSPCGPRTSEP
jgi:hypothetical protein